MDRTFQKHLTCPLCWWSKIAIAIEKWWFVIWWLKFFDHHQTHPHHQMATKKFWLLKGCNPLLSLFFFLFFFPFLCSYCHFMPFPPRLLGWLKKFDHHQTMGCIGWQPKRFDCHSTYFHHQMVIKEFHSPFDTHTIGPQPKFAQERKWGMKLFFNKMIAQVHHFRSPYDDEGMSDGD